MDARVSEPPLRDGTETEDPRLAFREGPVDMKKVDMKKLQAMTLLFSAALALTGCGGSSIPISPAQAQTAPQQLPRLRQVVAGRFADNPRSGLELHLQPVSSNPTEAGDLDLNTTGTAWIFDEGTRTVRGLEVYGTLTSSRCLLRGPTGGKLALIRGTAGGTSGYDVQVEIPGVAAPRSVHLETARPGATRGKYTLGQGVLSGGQDLFLIPDGTLDAGLQTTPYPMSAMLLSQNSDGSFSGVLKLDDPTPPTPADTPNMVATSGVSSNYVGFSITGFVTIGFYYDNLDQGPAALQFGTLTYQDEIPPHEWDTGYLGGNVQWVPPTATP